MTGKSLMDREPQLQDVVARAFVDGCTNQQIADQLGRGVHADTITDYKRHPGVMAISDRLTRERHLQITSKIDTALLKRLDHVDKIDTDTLLKIRKEILPERIEVTDKTKRSSIIEEMWDIADKDPEAAGKLMAALDGAAQQDQ